MNVVVRPAHCRRYVEQPGIARILGTEYVSQEQVSQEAEAVVERIASGAGSALRRMRR